MFVQDSISVPKRALQIIHVEKSYLILKFNLMIVISNFVTIPTMCTTNNLQNSTLLSKRRQYDLNTSNLINLQYYNLFHLKV